MGGEGTWPGRRVRADRPGESAGIPGPARGTVLHSGRVFVTAVVLSVLVLWGSLNLAFRHWRTGYRARAALGARVVATAVDPLVGVVPAGEQPAAVRAAGCAGVGAAAAAVSPLGEGPAAWRAAVDQTRAMLLTLTASNVLDPPAIRALGDRLRARVARTRPSNARAELAALWDEVEDQSGPIVLSHHPRPALLPPRRPKEVRWVVPKR